MTLSQDQLKALVGQAAVREVLPSIERGEILGVGTGSTVNKFIEALAPHASQVKGAVSSSVATTERLQAIGINVVPAQSVHSLGVYVDGADEINPQGHMVKGGGAALTREKIVAALAQQFICIVDESKCVPLLGGFALPVEVIPMAVNSIQRQFAALGGQAQLRMKGNEPLVTDNGQHILDVRGLRITDALAMEQQVNQWPGVVTVGIFALQRAHVALVASAVDGVRRVAY
jgi:ribose 5-phosphate isomerase A